MKIFNHSFTLDEIVENNKPQIIEFTNPKLDKRFYLWPYIIDGNLDLNTPWEPDQNLIGKFLEFKHKIYSNKDDNMNNIFTPKNYDYSFNMVRQLLLDADTMEIIADAGSRKIYNNTEELPLLKLNHRFYMDTEYREYYMKNRRIVDWVNQAFIKQQWVQGIKNNKEIMYETRGKSPGLWKLNFKIDSEFFNSKNGWFYTEKPITINNFRGYALIWYDKNKHTKSSALKYLKNL